MKLVLKVLVQTIFLILLIPLFLLGFLVGMMFYPARAGFYVFTPFAVYIANLRKERKQDE